MSSLRISGPQQTLARLWWGPARLVLEPLARRVLGGGIRPRRVLAGPLAGWTVTGGLAEGLGIYELEVQRRLLSLVSPGDTVYDVGANHGYLTLLAARAVGAEGSVVAFEPVPRLVAQIREAVLSAHVEARVRIEPRAVADRDGVARLHVPEADTDAQASLVTRGGHTINVAVTRLDDVSATESPPDLVKVDVEGAEVKVLDGSRRLLRGARPPRWLIEVHGSREHRAVTQRLVQHGYRIEDMPSRRSSRYPRHVVGLPPGGTQ